MCPEEPGPGFLLIYDTCTEAASLALFRGDRLLEELGLANRAASADLLRAVRTLLASYAISLADLDGVGVVNGPGSFTGVRVGLAAAKGMCEASGRLLATVSRLAVLADAAETPEGFAVLGAGRDQVYVREAAVTGEGRERLANLVEMESLLRGESVAVEAPELGAKLVEFGAKVRITRLSAKAALRLVRRSLDTGGSDLATSDANYVRHEDSIYASAMTRTRLAG